MPAHNEPMTQLQPFQGMSTAQIEQVVRRGDVLVLPDRGVAVRAGEEGDELFVVLAGTVRVQTSLRGARQVITRFGRGEIFGEMAFVARSVRTADVVAEGPVELLRVSRAFLEQMMLDAPEITARLLLNISLILCRRLEHTTDSWKEAKLEGTLRLFQALASETRVEEAFRRFADAIAQTLDQVCAVQLRTQEQLLTWPDANRPWLADEGPWPGGDQPLVALGPDAVVVRAPVPLGRREPAQIALEQDRTIEPSPEELTLLTQACGQLGLVVDRILLHEETLQLATTDALTGLTNRRVFTRELDKELTRIRRYDAPLALMVADLDHFKRVNDSHGHLAGDAVLKAVARCLVRSLRDVDLVCRYGGEEFVVLMPHTDESGARHAAERLRRNVEQLAVPFEQLELRITVSLGVATRRPDDTPQALFQRADDAVYAAKTGGRNRVTFAAP